MCISGFPHGPSEVSNSALLLNVDFMLKVQSTTVEACTQDMLEDVLSTYCINSYSDYKLMEPKISNIHLRLKLQSREHKSSCTLLSSIFSLVSSTLQFPFHHILFLFFILRTFTVYLPLPPSSMFTAHSVQ